MSQITRVYDNPKTAADAVKELKAASFNDAELVANGQGNSVVAVSAPFGKGAQVEQILNRHGGNGTSSSVPRGYRGNGQAAPSAAPLSRALHVPVLTDSHTNVSGVSRLSDSRTTSAALGLPELTSSDSFFSGFPLLIESKPFSSLASSQKPFSSLAHNQNGSASLIDNPAPLSSLLGFPVLLPS
jgi:hypothetical protein